MNLEQIDTSTTAGKAEVMRLAAEGRRVAYLSGWNGKWVACGSDPVTWNWESMDYAIIAETACPDEVWLTFNEAGKLFATSDCRPEWQQPGISHVRYLRVDR